MIRSVAVVGVGSMGAAIARRIRAAGFELCVCDVNEAVLRGFEADGVRATRRAADCAAADLVIVLVATPEQAHGVLLGPGGLREGLGRPGPAPLVALMSTVPVETVHALRAGLGDAIAGLLDAPISGGLVKAESGTLAVMAGGDAAQLEAARPVLRTFASQIVRCGGPGAGQAMKIVNNILGIATAVLSAEAYRLATELGLDMVDAAHALEIGTGRNFFSADPAGPGPTYAAMTRDRAGFDALLAILRKDSGFAADLAAASTQARYPAIAGMKAVIAALGDETWDTWRHVAGAPART